ncbi:MAG: ABC transporter permease [Bryobacterales bacterium]|nr:ABC transporter permease [Bryobacterales bacterium]
MSRVPRWWKRGSRDAAIREEIEMHIAMRAELLEKEGLGRNDALATARRMFGSTVNAHEELWRMDTHWIIESVTQDTRYAIRALRKHPGFALAAIGTLALGIGVTTAVFSAVDRTLFREAPYPEPERLVSIGMRAPVEPGEFLIAGDYFAWKDAQRVFETFSSWSGTTECDITEPNPARVVCGRVGYDFLAMLRVQPVIGRAFTAEEDRPGAPQAVIITHDLWRSRYGSDPSLINRTIALDGKQARVVGVLPSGFELPVSSAALLVPQALARVDRNRPAPMQVVRAFARLKPGVSIEQARQAMGPIFGESLKYVPRGFLKEVHLSVVPLRERQTRDSRGASLLLFAAVFVVLLIACANVANLLLARAASREQELAIRAALGAGRLRLLRQNLTESALLSVMGGLLGAALAYVLLQVFIEIAPEGLRELSHASIDLRALCFAFALSLASSVLFGLVPALSLRRNPGIQSARTVTASRTWFQDALLVLQIGASLVLLTAAGLLLRSLWKLQQEPLGMVPDQVVTAEVVLGQQGYSAEGRIAFFQELERRISAIPGLQTVAIADSIPPSGRTQAMIYHLIDVEGRPSVAEGTGGMVVWRLVTPGYFRALGIRIAKGRAFHDEERREGNEAVVISSLLARKLFGDGDAIGKRLRFGRRGNWHTVVGIAEDVHNAGLEAPPDPEYYLPRRLGIGAGAGTPPPESQRRAVIVARTALNATLARQWLKQAIAESDPKLPVEVTALGNRVDKLAERPRFNAMLLMLFSVVGLGLAAVGLYGVGSYLVAQRTKEIGIRVALGATQHAVTAMVLRRAVWTLLGGTLLGTGTAAAARNLLRGLLYGTGTLDAFAVLTALGVLLVVALAAAWLPARKAARLDPVAALRQD